MCEGKRKREMRERERERGREGEWACRFDLHGESGFTVIHVRSVFDASPYSCCPVARSEGELGASECRGDARDGPRMIQTWSAWWIDRNRQGLGLYRNS